MYQEKLRKSKAIQIIIKRKRLRKRLRNIIIAETGGDKLR